MDEQKKALIFQALIQQLHLGAMLAMGKIADPQSGEAQVNLPLAEHQIDTLAMLRDKTEGNLTKQEVALMDSLLTSLRLTYVAEARRSPEEEEPGPEEGAEEDLPVEEEPEAASEGPEDRPEEGGAS